MHVRVRIERGPDYFQSSELIGFILEFELFDTFSKLETSFSSDRWVCEVNDSLVIISLGMSTATNATVKTNKEMQ